MHGGSTGAPDPRQRSWQLVLAHRDLLRLTLAFAGSSTGDWALATGLAVWAFSHGGATLVATFLVARLALIGVLLPLALPILDRVPHRSVMIIIDSARLVLLALTAALVYLDAPVWTVLVAAITAAVIGGAFRPAQLAMLPQLTSSSASLAAANAVSSLVESVTFFLGPAAAAVLLATAGVWSVFLFDALSFGWSVLLLCRIRRIRATTPAAGHGTHQVVHDTVAGFQVIARDRRLQVLGLLASAQLFLAGVSQVLIVIVADEVLASGDLGVAYLDMGLGLAAVLGGLMVMRRLPTSTPGLEFALGVALWAAGTLMIGIWPMTISCVFGYALMGFGNPFVDVHGATLTQHLAPPEVRGRVFAVFEAGQRVSMALGVLATPIVVEALGLTAGLVVLAMPTLVGALACTRALSLVDRQLRPTVSAVVHLVPAGRRVRLAQSRLALLGLAVHLGSSTVRR